MNLRIEFEREDRETDVRWIADVVDLPGCMVYGATYHEALAKAKALAYRVLAEEIGRGKRYDTGVEWYVTVPDGAEEMPDALKKLQDEYVKKFFARSPEIPITVGEHNGEVFAKCNTFDGYTGFGKDVAAALAVVAQHIEYKLAELREPEKFPPFETLTVQLKRDEHGYINFTCPELPSAMSFGTTIRDTLANAAEAIELCLESGERPVGNRDGKEAE